MRHRLFGAVPGVCFDSLLTAWHMQPHSSHTQFVSQPAKNGPRCIVAPWQELTCCVCFDSLMASPIGKG